MRFGLLQLTAFVGALVCTLLLPIFFNSFSSFTSPLTPKDNVRLFTRAKYSGISIDEGEIFSVDRFRARRQRRSIERPPVGVRGIARDCGRACHLRLRSTNNISIVVHLHRWHAIGHLQNKTAPVLENSQIVPLVQYFDGPDNVSARLSKATSDCIYRARVVGVHERSVINLCDEDGLHGLLLLPDGVYQVEPIDDGSNSTSTRHATHILHRFQPQTFHSPDDSTPKTPLFYDNGTWEDSIERNRRSRRSANSWDHYVEVMLVADSKMYQYHGPNLEDYVLTLFSSVSSIYRHQSLRASVNVVVVKLVILKTEDSGPHVSSNAQDTLHRFCRWQSYYNDRDDDSPNHHDVAILLTRGDICRAAGKCDTLGLAELGTMCDMQKSCAIIEDNGLSAAFTIAHELGHIFNIPHDDEGRCSKYMQVTKSNFHIMAPTLEYNTHPWSWSACSSGMLERFLDNHRGQIQCLFDQPVERKYYEALFDSDAPGRKYDVHRQCQFVFGAQSELCPYMPACRRLWCATYYGSQMGCRTQHMPWADGTPCDRSDAHKHCHRGECVHYQAESRTKIDGGWGDWQQWGACSRTCGGGVQKALRDCDNPRPSNGGKYCVGQREQYRSCNTHECPWDTADFREVQCAEFNNKDVGIHGVAPAVSWVPKYTEVANNERCKLYCRIPATAASYLLRDKVVDGTPCDRNGDDICVDGTCMKAGCDHVLHSAMKRDRCGICGGDGSSCRIVKGVYNERGSFGYNEVMKIPAGSANIDIRQHGYNNQKDDDNYLSLRSSNGEFILNGHFQVSVFRQQIPIQDVILEYSGSDNVVERINGTGPIRSDIYVHVLSVGHLYPPDIRYEYMVSVESGAPRQPQLGYFWRHGDRWTDCDRVCQGTQQQEIICVDARSDRQTNERMCQMRKPQPNTRMCNIECSTRWHTEDLTACSVQCGSGEKRQRVTCVRTDNGHITPVRESDCDRNTRPAERVPCQIDCSGRRWSYTEWSQCSVTCGGGVSTRNASCLDPHGRSLSESHCGTKEVLSRPCAPHHCPRWIYGHWSECSRSCDGGVRMRHAQCLDAAEREVDPRMCGKKHDRETCNDHLCTSWSFSSWSDCSVTCGEGVQTRNATCMSRDGQMLEDARCNHRERIIQKQCTRPACPTWKTGEWTTCSVSCLDGWSTRRVSCVDNRGNDLPMERCPDKDRPPSHKPCNQGPCPFWRTGPWTSCSVSCGTGVRQRTLECVYREQVVDSSFCADSPPLSSQTCVLLPCNTWETGQWSTCSATCGSGFQERDVYCISGKDQSRTVDYMCDNSTRPRNKKTCERDACAMRQVVAPVAEVPILRWATGPWSPCSVSCGNGTQKRLVKCRDHIRDLSDDYCKQMDKPDEEQICQRRPCAYWKTGPWMPCPETCGIHVQQTRSVMCVPHESREEVVETDCDASQRPASAKSCHLEHCPIKEPPLGIWKTGDWSDCSTSCGKGWRRRLVSCSTTACADDAKPNAVETCNIRSCPIPSNNTWQISPWTHCSVTCGGGIQRRRVWCEDVSTLKAQSDADCPDSPKPTEQRDCELSPCATDESQPQWQTSPWSSCSVKCGRGVRRRQVACVDARTNTTLASSRCDASRRPVEEHKCRVMHCPRWRGGPWGTCSTTCGTGVRHREVFCQRGRRQRGDLQQCASIPRPPTEARCFLAACPAYHWSTTPWSKCLDSCQKGEQHRRVYCMSNTGKRAAPRMCAASPTPITTKPCDLTRCPYEWVPGPWQTCSRTCGTGSQMRTLECRVKGNSTTKTLATVPRERCGALPAPRDTQQCDLNPCEAEHHWQIGPWESCSRTCGQGVRRRKVRCYHRTGRRVSRTLCEITSPRPRRTQSCFQRNCLPSTCQEIRSQDPTQSTDGNYTVLLDGFPITVYCHRMNETIPGTYITVDPMTNFAEIYGKRLIYPHTCPFNGNRNDSCECTDNGDAGAGFTRFSKIRVDLFNRKININDFTFASTERGTPVSYGTAGDCYSMKDCPQGRFSVDLLGSRLRIVDDLQWEDKGLRTSSRIDRTANNARIEGRCGGFCGKCSPDKYKGLVFEVDSRQR